MRRKDTVFDDAAWQKIPVPAYWEDCGFKDLDGTAWYRTTVRIPEKLTKNKLILMLGKINDVDEVYFNGHQIGKTGEFPSGDKRAQAQGTQNIERAYFIPGYIINEGQANTIAVRVHDVINKGGIYAGPIGITTREKFMQYQRRK